MMIRDDDDWGGEKWHYCQVVPAELDSPWKTILILRPLYQSPGDKTMPCQPLKTQWHTIISMYPIASSAGWPGSSADLIWVWLQPVGSDQVCSMELSSVWDKQSTTGIVLSLSHMPAPWSGGQDFPYISGGKSREVTRQELWIPRRVRKWN